MSETTLDGFLDVLGLSHLKPFFENLFLDNLQVLKGWSVDDLVAEGCCKEDAQKIVDAILGQKYTSQSQNAPKANVENILEEIQQLSDNIYNDFGLNKNATPEEIKKQFKYWTLKYHPDKNQGNTVEATEIFCFYTKLHDVLHDPQLRSAYDKLQQQQQQHSFSPSPSVFSQAFEEKLQQQRARTMELQQQFQQDNERLEKERQQRREKFEEDRRREELVQREKQQKEEEAKKQRKEHRHRIKDQEEAKRQQQETEERLRAVHRLVQESKPQILLDLYNEIRREETLRLTQCVQKELDQERTIIRQDLRRKMHEEEKQKFYWDYKTQHEIRQKIAWEFEEQIRKEEKESAERQRVSMRHRAEAQVREEESKRIDRRKIQLEEEVKIRKAERIKAEEQIRKEEKESAERQRVSMRHRAEVQVREEESKRINQPKIQLKEEEKIRKEQLQQHNCKNQEEDHREADMEEGGGEGEGPDGTPNSTTGQQAKQQITTKWFTWKSIIPQ